MFSLLIAGAAGGTIRGIVGFLKHQFAYKNVKFEPLYFGFTVGLSAVVGVSATWVLTTSGIDIPNINELNPAIAFFVGYAGGDFLENVFKIFTKKISFFPHLPK